MPKVIYAWNYVEWGGAQIHFLALIKEARNIFDVTVVLPEGTDEQFLGFLDAERVSYVKFRGNIDLTQKSGLFEKLRRHLIRAGSEYAMLKTIEDVRTDESIIHTDILPAQSLLSLVWLCLRAPVFTTLHNALPPVSRWRWTLWKLKFGLISRFDNFHVFCTNEHAARFFSRLFSKRIANGIQITYDSINPTEIDEALKASVDRVQILTELQIPTGKFLVLALGQFGDRKGRWTFLDAAKYLAARTDDVMFVWVTPKLPPKADTERINSYDLGERFRLVRSGDIGPERQDILKFFRVAELFVLPSFVEGVPIALLEAMAIGLPCVSTNVYGIPEAIIDDQTGLLIEAGDAGALSDAILRLVNDPQLRDQLGKQARQMAITKFDERVAAKTATSAYMAALRQINDGTRS